MAASILYTKAGGKKDGGGGAGDPNGVAVTAGVDNEKKMES